jgi:hypothetical protein
MKPILPLCLILAFSFPLISQTQQSGAPAGALKAAAAPGPFDPKRDAAKDLQDAIAKGNVRWMIVRRRDMPKLDTPTTVEISEASYPWETDYNYRNKVVLVRVGSARDH